MFITGIKVSKEVPAEEMFKESDSRGTAISIGCMAFICVILQLVLIIVLDIHNLIKMFHLMKRF